MRCPECDFGMMDDVGHTDVILKSGNVSKCVIHHMKCLKCGNISKWRREGVYTQMKFKLQED